MFRFDKIKGANYRYDYSKLTEDLNKCYVDKNAEEAKGIIRDFCRADLFFLLYFGLGLPINHSWLVDRVNEVQECCNRTLDLWARFHWKSSIITIGKTIQDVLNNPEERIGIFSHTRDIAQKFIQRIKQIFESNELIKNAFNDILYEKPKRQSPKWSENDGLIIRRKGAFQESTVEAWGLVDSQPIGLHFTKRRYDDIVTKEGTNTPFQMEKVGECFRLSMNLRDAEGEHNVVGTRYHFGDLYSELIKSGGYKVREYPGTMNGDFPAKPGDETDNLSALGNDVGVLYNPKQMWEFFKDMGRDVYAAQVLLNPSKASIKAFNLEWIKYFREKKPFTRNYIFVDPADSKDKSSDYTVILVIGICSRGNYYVLDSVRDRLDIFERIKILFDLVEKWKINKVFYEKYGMQVDIACLDKQKREEGVHFKVETLGGHLAKRGRILRLQPLFQAGNIIFRETIPYRDINNKVHDLVADFINEEYLDYPSSAHDDFLDCLSRIKDEDVKLPKPEYVEPETEKRKSFIFDMDYDTNNEYNWMTL